MSYKEEVPPEQQIRLDQFPLFPGDNILYRHEFEIYPAVVKEVGSANPEYVLGGPKAKDAGVERWTIKERAECERFIKGGEHLPVPLKLKKSMWAVIEFDVRSERTRKPKRVEKTLYTYDIQDLISHGDIRLPPFYPHT